MHESVIIDMSILQFADDRKLNSLGVDEIWQESCFVGTKDDLTSKCVQLGISPDIWKNSSPYEPKMPKINPKEVNELMKYNNVL